MNKAKIERMAHEARVNAAQAGAKPTTAQPKSRMASAIAPDAQSRQTREKCGAVNLTPETIDAIVGGFSRELRRALLEIGPMLARLAAADTIHCVERKATIMGRSLIEGQTAAALLAESGVKA